MKKVTGILAAATLAFASTAATAHPLSLAGTADLRSAATLDGASDLRGEDATSIGLGFLVLVAIIAVAVIGGDESESP